MASSILEFIQAIQLEDLYLTEIKDTTLALIGVTSATTHQQRLLAIIQVEVQATIKEEALGATKEAIILGKLEVTIRIEAMEPMQVVVFQDKVEAIMVIKVLGVCMADILVLPIWGLITQIVMATHLLTTMGKCKGKEDRVTKRIDYTESEDLYYLSIQFVFYHAYNNSWKD